MPRYEVEQCERALSPEMSKVSSSTDLCDHVGRLDSPVSELALDQDLLWDDAIAFQATHLPGLEDSEPVATIVRRDSDTLPKGTIDQFPNPSHTRPAKSCQRERRPSESFFESSSSEDESDDGASAKAVVENFRCLKISRVSKSNDMCSPDQSNALDDKTSGLDCQISQASSSADAISDTIETCLVPLMLAKTNSTLEKYPKTVSPTVEHKDESSQAADLSVPLDQLKATDRAAINQQKDKPLQSESLLINISLAANRCANVFVDLSSANSLAHDDEVLFNCIRSIYFKELLGWQRIGFRFVRDVAYVTISKSDAVADDQTLTQDFLKHFNDPRLGRNKQVWTIRLQELDATDCQVYSKPPGHKPWSTPPFPTMQDDRTDPSTIRIVFHHNFSFWMVVFLFICTLCLSISSVVMWSVFGISGTQVARPLSGNIALTRSLDEGADYTSERILTGLVLGIMVLMIGILAEICLLAGGWLLL